MILERVLNVIVITCWLIFFAFILRFLIATTLNQGFLAALKGLLKKRILYTLLVIAAGISLLNSSLVFVEPQEVGVVISLFAPNGYRTRPLRSGLHWIVPLAEEVHTFPIYWQTYTMAAKPNEGAVKGDDSIAARTSDGQEVIIDCSIIFQINPEEAPRIYVEWQERYIDDLVRPLIRGLMRSYVSQYKVDEVNSSKRTDLENDLSTELKADLSGKGFVMDRFLLRNITFSKEYAAAVESKQVAQQEVISKQYQAEQIQKLAAGEAQKTLINARAEAQAITLLGEALAKNPNVITLRYVDKLSPNIKVMLVPNANPYILPMDTLLNSVPNDVITPTSTVQAASPAPTAMPTMAPTATPIP